MADLRCTFAGIESPNPFWLASAPPTDKEYNVVRAFEAGWGGVVWKTLGEAGPPIVNVNGPRYAALYSQDRRLIGFNNIELITDRPLEVNLAEIRASSATGRTARSSSRSWCRARKRPGRRSCRWSRTPAATASS
jgi:dihydropyrimidine dehydrogenase (NAD+) subunit PreA